MTQDGVAKDDVKVPEGDLGKQIQADFDDGKDLLVTIISAMGEEQVRCFLITAPYIHSLPPPKLNTTDPPHFQPHILTFSSFSVLLQAISVKEAPKVN